MTQKLGTAKAGAVTTVARGETSTSPTFDVLMYRGVSDGLAAGTISGTIDFAVFVSVTSGAADFVTHLHLYVTQGDSDTPRGTLVADHVESLATREWGGGGTSAVGVRLENPVAVTPVAVQAGDRLVLEVGYQAQNVTATNRSATLRYGGTTEPDTDQGDATNRGAWLDVPDPVAAGGGARSQAVFVG